MAISVANKTSDEADVLLDINTTPLIDVMLVLLVMLIITIPAQLHSVDLDMPTPAPAAQKQDPVVIDIGIGADNAIRWNGMPLANLAELDDRFDGARDVSPSPEIHVHAHPDARYDQVTAVLARAQRHGLRKVGIAGV